nr:unnamed protein product [Callosobruchus analis]
MFTTLPGYNLVGKQSDSGGLQVRRRRGKIRMAAEGTQQLFDVCKQLVGNEVDLTSWENKIKEEMNIDIDSDEQVEIEETHQLKSVDTQYYEYERYSKGVLTVGCIGQPNVGKSSLMNAIMGKKVVSVSKTPGHTKHFQTIFLAKNVRLCDCPGLVFPSKVPKTLQVLMGSYPIAQLREPYTTVKYLAERLDLVKLLRIDHPSNDDTWSAMDICDGWAKKRRFYTAKAARLDSYRAANSILRMALDGKICLCHRPPSYSEKKDYWSTHPEVKVVQWIQARSSDDSDQQNFISSDFSDDSEEESVLSKEKHTKYDKSDDENDDDEERDSESEQEDSEEELPYCATNKFAYLENNKSKDFINVNDMADELQRTYREYANRKRSAFRASVNKAYSVVLEQYGLSSDNSEEESVISADSGEEEPTTSKQFNDSMNNQIVDLYKMNASKNIDENELIDISSEDSDDEEAMRAALNVHAANVLRDEIMRSAAAATATAPPENNKAHAATNEKYLAEIKKGNAAVVAEKGKKRKLNEYVAVTSTQKNSTSKKKKQNGAFEEIKFSFKDVGGMDKTLEEVCKLLLHITHPEIYKSIGTEHSLIESCCSRASGSISGESEERIRELFDQSVKLSPCILFIDEIDAITPNRQNAQKDMEKRIVAQLLSCLDGNRVLVIGATNRPDSIDPALRRAGRFDREISLGIPNKDSRVQILKVLTGKLKLMDGFDFERVAANTPALLAPICCLWSEKLLWPLSTGIFNPCRKNGI